MTDINRIEYCIGYTKSAELQKIYTFTFQYQKHLNMYRLYYFLMVDIPSKPTFVHLFMIILPKQFWTTNYLLCCHYEQYLQNFQHFKMLIPIGSSAPLNFKCRLTNMFRFHFEYLKIESSCIMQPLSLYVL